MKYKLDHTKIEDRFEILAKADAATASRKVKISVQKEIAAYARACRSNPHWIGNWEELMEELEKINL
jgi:hypothetical protein